MISRIFKIRKIRIFYLWLELGRLGVITVTDNTLCVLHGQRGHLTSRQITGCLLWCESVSELIRCWKLVNSRLRPWDERLERLTKHQSHQRQQWMRSSSSSSSTDSSAFINSYQSLGLSLSCSVLLSVLSLLLSSLIAAPPPPPPSSSPL